MGSDGSIANVDSRGAGEGSKPPSARYSESPLLSHRALRLAVFPAGGHGCLVFRRRGVPRWSVSNDADFDPTAVPVRPAATVMLVDDRPDLHVLMMRRNDKTVFAGGMWVFPGGRVDESDASPILAEAAGGGDGRWADDWLDIDAGGQAFWIEGLNESGDTVCAQSARCYHIFEGSLADELMSLRLFYDDLSKTGATEACNCRAPSAFRLGSSICYCGGTWVRPDFRRGSLASLMVRISRVLAFLKWDFDYSISLAEPEIVDKGVVRAYGYPNVEPGIEWVNSASEEDLRLLLVWMDRAELLRDLSDAIDLAEKVRVKTPKSQGRPEARSRSGTTMRPDDPQAARSSVHAQR